MCAGRRESRSSRQMARLCCNLQKRFGSCLEQDAVDDPLIRQCQGAQLGWQREHDVKVGNVEQFRLPGLQPSRAGRSLALGTMAIATGVVGKPAMPAGVASFFVAAEGGRPAGGQVAEGLSLFAAQDGAVAGQQFAADGAKTSPNSGRAAARRSSLAHRRDSRSKRSARSTRPCRGPSS